jgi:hypothetical protein
MADSYEHGSEHSDSIKFLGNSIIDKPLVSFQEKLGSVRLISYVVYLLAERH